MLLYSYLYYHALLKTLGREDEIAISWFEENELIVNPSKFQVIIANRCKNPDALYTLIINNQVFELIDSLILLGTKIISKLSFDSSLSRICKKLGIKSILLAGF